MEPGLKGLLDLQGDNWLVNHVYAHLSKDDSQRRIGSGWFHPSSLSVKCDALLAFEFLGAPKRTDLDPRTQHIFSVGHDRDRTWKRWLRESGLSLVSEDRSDCARCGILDVDGRHICIPSARIRGECDDVVRNPFTLAPSIFEFKTMNDWQHKSLAMPLPEHVIQVHPYMHAKAILSAVIVYENKNDQKLKSYTVNFDHDTWLWIVERCQRILDLLSRDFAPERTPTSFETSCDFFPICSTAEFPALVEAYRTKAGLLG